MVRTQHVWEPIACPEEGFHAPIGEVCLELFSKSSRPCLRTLGGDVLRKKAFLEELGLEDVPLKLLVVVQRRPDGGWWQVGSVPELAAQQQHFARYTHAPAAVQLAEPAVPAAAVVEVAPAAVPAPAVAAWAGGAAEALPVERIPAVQAAPAGAPAPAPVPAAAVAVPRQAAVLPAAPPPPAAPPGHGALQAPAPGPAAAPLAPGPQAAAPPPAAEVPVLPPRLPAPLPLAHLVAAGLQRFNHHQALADLLQLAGQQHMQVMFDPAAAAPPPAPPPAPVIAALPPVPVPAPGVAVLPPPPAPAPAEPPVLQPAPAPPAAPPALLRSPPKPVPPAHLQELLQQRRSTSRRRSLLGCAACKSLRRGASAAEAAAALTCPLCFCEVDPEHTHLDCQHPYCNDCLGSMLHAAYQRGQHPECQAAACRQLLSAEDLQQGVLVLCDSAEVQRQRAAARLPALEDPWAVYQRFSDLAAAAVARGSGELIECARCRFMMLAEADAPEDAPCPNCRVGRPIREAREAAERPRGIQQLEGGERVLYCPACGFGPQQKAQASTSSNAGYCNKLTCGGCQALLCWSCGEQIRDRRAYDHFRAGACSLYGLPGERPQMDEGEAAAAQQAAVQRETYYLDAWTRLIHPAHDAVRSMRRATPADLQREEELWRRVAPAMHNALEQAFNEVAEAAAAREEQLPLPELRAQLMPRAQERMAAVWPGWDVWEGVTGDVLRAVQRALG